MTTLQPCTRCGATALSPLWKPCPDPLGHLWPKRTNVDLAALFGPVKS